MPHKGLTTPVPPGKVVLPPKAMQRIALLAAAFALAACSSRSPWAGGAAKPPVATPESAAPIAAAPAVEQGAAPAAPAAGAAKYSWQAKEKAGAETTAAEGKSGPPNDETKVRILALRPESGLLAFARKEKPEDGAFLQLTKGDKALLVRVVRSDDVSTTADIVAGQDPAKTPALEVNEEVICGAPADLPPQ